MGNPWAEAYERERSKLSLQFGIGKQEFIKKFGIREEDFHITDGVLAQYAKAKRKYSDGIKRPDVQSFLKSTFGRSEKQPYIG